MTPLAEHLADLRQRGISIGVHDGDRVSIDGPATDADAAMVHRHAHALAIAAAGTHPTWWLHVLGRGPAPSVDELPVTADPDTIDGLAFRCSTCGHPADFLEADLLAWCEAHAPDRGDER